MTLKRPATSAKIISCNSPVAGSGLYFGRRFLSGHPTSLFPSDIINRVGPAWDRNLHIYCRAPSSDGIICHYSSCLFHFITAFPTSQPIFSLLLDGPSSTLTRFPRIIVPCFPTHDGPSSLTQESAGKSVRKKGKSLNVSGIRWGPRHLKRVAIRHSTDIRLSALQSYVEHAPSEATIIDSIEVEFEKVAPFLSMTPVKVLMPNGGDGTMLGPLWALMARLCRGLQQ